MVGWMLDKNEVRDVALLYSAKTLSELAYTDLFNEAHNILGMKTVATLTDLDHLPADWQGHRGYIDAGLIASEVPDYNERLFFISGPHSLVSGASKVLRNMGVDSRNIKTDYFPGFA